LRNETEKSSTANVISGVWEAPLVKNADQTNAAGNKNNTQLNLLERVEDEQAKFNLHNLVRKPSPRVWMINSKEVASFERLLALLGMETSLAKATALQLRAGLMQATSKRLTPQNSPLGKVALTSQPALQMTYLDALLDVPGFTPQTIARLRPFVTILPTPTPLNMNTASAEVITSVIPEVSLAAAQTFVSQRAATFFHDIGQAQLALAGAQGKNLLADARRFTVKSAYFQIHARVQYEHAHIDRTTLLYRDPNTHAIDIMTMRDSPNTFNH
jgi:general secretion pathway protein K